MGLRARPILAFGGPRGGGVGGAQQEASQALAQEGANAYMEFLNSMFSYYRGSLDEAQKQAKR